MVLFEWTAHVHQIRCRMAVECKPTVGTNVVKKGSRNGMLWREMKWIMEITGCKTELPEE